MQSFGRFSKERKFSKVPSEKVYLLNEMIFLKPEIATFIST